MVTNSHTVYSHPINWCDGTRCWRLRVEDIVFPSYNNGRVDRFKGDNDPYKKPTDVDDEDWLKSETEFSAFIDDDEDFFLDFVRDSGIDAQLRSNLSILGSEGNHEYRGVNNKRVNGTIKILPPSKKSLEAWLHGMNMKPVYYGVYYNERLQKFIVWYGKEPGNDINGIEIPIAFHRVIGKGIESPFGMLKTDITCTELQSRKEMIDSIYTPAGIKFSVNSCGSYQQLDANTKEIFQGGPEDVRAIERIIGKDSPYDMSAINVYLVPAVNKSTNAYRQHHDTMPFIIMGTNNPGTGQQYDEKYFSVVLAHEIGHHLGLIPGHIDDPKNFMHYQSPHGELLNTDQIRTVRERAKLPAPTFRKGTIKTFGDVAGKGESLNKGSCVNVF